MFCSFNEFKFSVFFSLFFVLFTFACVFLPKSKTIDMEYVVFVHSYAVYWDVPLLYADGNWAHGFSASRIIPKLRLYWLLWVANTSFACSPWRLRSTRAFLLLLFWRERPKKKFQKYCKTWLKRRVSCIPCSLHTHIFCNLIEIQSTHSNSLIRMNERWHLDDLIYLRSFVVCRVLRVFMAHWSSYYYLW